MSLSSNQSNVRGSKPDHVMDITQSTVVMLLSFMRGNQSLLWRWPCRLSRGKRLTHETVADLFRAMVRAGGRANAFLRPQSAGLAA